jgi:transcription initiation factor TFIIIB Brf1 subunit/transcription initiation factor TFIIB
MQTFDLGLACPECSKDLVDAFDELVCPDCGIVQDKEVVELPRSKGFAANDFTKLALGSFLGSPVTTGKERSPRRFAESHSEYRYLKKISDFVGREDTSTYECLKLIERVSDCLMLPREVMADAIVTAKKILNSRNGRPRVTTASVSTFALILSCKARGGLSIGTREILEAHRSLGRRVKVSSIIRLTLDTQIKAPASRPEDYLPRILARLSQNRALIETLAAQKVAASPYFRELRGTALEILSSVGEDLKAGRRPSALAATSVYASETVLAGRDLRPRRISQREVAESGDTAEYTVREQFRQIFNPSLLHSRSGRSRALPAPLTR